MADEGSPATEGARPEAVCPNCMTGNDPRAHFCRQCGAPLTSHAAIDPLGRIYATGYVYRQAVSRPRPLIVFLGMWLIFAPAFAHHLTMLVDMLQQLLAPESSSDPILALEQGPAWPILGAAMVGGLMLLHGAILFKVTWNYFKTSRSAAPT